MKNNCPSLSSSGILAFGLLLSACGGGGSGSTGSIGGPKPQTGPNGILNGASLAAATTHWTATRCGVQVELTTDHGFYSIVVDNKGTTSAGTEQWALGPDPTSIQAGPGTGLAGFFWVSSLGTITGSFASQTFTASVVVKSGSGTSQSLGSCSFTLAQGNLNK
jgi:hypothetical protein